MKRARRGLTIVLVPDEGEASRSIRLSGLAMQVVLYAGIALGVLMVIMAATWWFLAVRTARSWELQAAVDSLEAEQARVAVLAEELGRVEAEYERLRLLFGSPGDSVSPDLWLPPAGIPGAEDTSLRSAEQADLPSSWPLTQPGFITRSLLAEESADHPGLDIAVGADSYIRAAGPGRVLRLGEDPVYGRFVVLEHVGGYQTVYAHASTLLVERGQRVRRAEVIALTGSTGRSTAPHLHFEILLDGTPVDPLSMVDQPS